MNWRFVAFGWAGYALVWGLAGYLAAAWIVLGTSPLDARAVVGTALLFSPFGTFFGLMAAESGRHKS